MDYYFSPEMSRIVYRSSKTEPMWGDSLILPQTQGKSDFLPEEIRKKCIRKCFNGEQNINRIMEKAFLYISSANIVTFYPVRYSVNDSNYMPNWLQSCKAIREVLVETKPNQFIFYCPVESKDRSGKSDFFAEIHYQDGKFGVLCLVPTGPTSIDFNYADHVKIAIVFKNIIPVLKKFLLDPKVNLSEDDQASDDVIARYLQITDRNSPNMQIISLHLKAARDWMFNKLSEYGLSDDRVVANMAEEYFEHNNKRAAWVIAERTLLEILYTFRRDKLVGV